jgi:sRNA-binding carbon storage regulator CsrA
MENVMLVLKRNKDERIILTLPDGSRITVQVVSGGSVTLGIEAQSAVGIWREEIAPAAAGRPAGSLPSHMESR